MKLLLFTLVGLVLTMSAAPASADVVSELRDCSTFAVNETRLACYDKLAKDTPVPAVTIAPAPKVLPAPKKAKTGSRKATAAEIALLRTQVQDRVKDPDSVKLRRIVVGDLENGLSRRVCGEANAKNSYGGYVGFQTFIGLLFYDGKRLTEASVLPLDSSDSTLEMCTQYGLIPR